MMSLWLGQQPCWIRNLTNLTPSHQGIMVDVEHLKTKILLSLMHCGIPESSHFNKNIKMSQLSPTDGFTRWLACCSFLSRAWLWPQSLAEHAHPAVLTLIQLTETTASSPYQTLQGFPRISSFYSPCFLTPFMGKVSSKISQTNS